MRFKAATILAALALLTPANARARTQQQEQKDEKIIEDFVTTRGFIIEVAKPAAKPKTKTRRRPTAVAKKTTPTNGVKQGGDGAAGSSDVAAQKAQPAGQSPADVAASGAGLSEDGVQIIKAGTLPPLALGHSIYVRDEATGGMLPAPAGRSYRSGDSIVLVLETNSDGYIYVFNAEDGKNPVMIYPDVRLRDGANEVRAHIRETYPDDPELPFKFDDRPANEHVYIVLSREPLAGVPAGAALKKYCGKNVEECEWRPTAAQWARISAASLDRGVRQATIAQADTQPVMPVMLQRGIRVKKDAPKPMTVRVSDTPGAKILVTKIELLHK